MTKQYQAAIKKAKWLSEEALQIAVKRREVKSKGENLQNVTKEVLSRKFIAIEAYLKEQKKYQTEVFAEMKHILDGFNKRLGEAEE